MVLAYDSVKPSTRMQRQKHLQGASALASSPRLRSLSSPGTPLEVQVAALQSPAGRRETPPLSLGIQLLEDVSLLASETSVDIVTLEEEVHSPARSSTPSPTPHHRPAPLVVLQDIVTSRSQVLPELQWMHDLNATIEVPASPAPIPLLSLQQQVRTLQQIPDPVDQAVEHLFDLVEAAVSEEPVLEQDALVALDQGSLDISEVTGPGLLSLQPPLVPTPARAPARNTPDVTLVTDDEVYINLGSETCTLCGEKCKDVKNLQTHFVERHCNHSSQVLKLLEKQQQILNSILAKQNTQEKSMNIMSNKQTCVIGDIKELKKTVESNRITPRLVALPVSAVTPPLVTARPAPPPVPLPGPPPALPERSLAGSLTVVKLPRT